MPAAGSKLGPYEILGAIGSGGMGEVYRARDPRIGREVAIKILPPDFSQEAERMHRFEQEARATGALNHPNILAIYDVGSYNGSPYLVSELLRGETLRERLKDGPLPVKKLLDLAVQIADGLAAAHEARIVHRDLKPENLFLTIEMRAKILDFGLAKLRPQLGSEEEETASGVMTQTGMIQGTVPYMSPEQAAGKSLDFRSDQFAFGSILYEMATGKRAFQRDSAAQTMSAIITEEPPPIREINSKLPAPLCWLIERCMAKDPRDRYGATIDLYRDLRDLRDRLLEATSTGAMALVPSRKWMAKRILLWALLFLLPVSAFIIAAYLFSSTGVDLSSYRVTPLTTDAGFEDNPSWSPDGKTVAYTAKVNGISQIFSRSLESSIPAQITKLPANCHDPFWSTDGTRIFFSAESHNAMDLWAVGAAGGSPDLVMENVMGGTISPDGKTIVFMRENGNSSSLWISTPPGANPSRFPPSVFDTKDYHAGILNFSPDGSKIAMTLNPTRQTGRLTELWILPFPKGKPHRLLQNSSDPVPDWKTSWMPDSRHIVLAANFQKAVSLWMVDSESGEIERLTVGSRDESPSVSPDGSKIAFTISDQDFDLIEIPLDGSPPHNLLATSREERDPAWSPAGNQYVYVTDRSGAPEIWMKSQMEGWDRPMVTQKNFGDDLTSNFAHPTFSPDGQRISYFRSGEEEKYALWISAVAGGPPVFLASGLAEHSWSPDGGWIAYVEGSPDGFRLVKKRAGGADPKVILSQQGPAHVGVSRSLAWSPTGEWISYPTEDGISIISSDGKTKRLLQERNPLIAGWSKDGQTIYGVFRDRNRSLFLSGIDIRTEKEKIILDLGSAPYSSIRGFSLAADGKSFITSVERSEGDLWILEGFPKPRRFFDFLSRN